MRMCALALTALVGCAAISARAEEPAANITVPAATAQPAAPATAPAAPSSAPAAGPVDVSKPVSPDAEAAKSAAESKADKQPSLQAGARFGFERVDGGYLRLDYRTGHLSYCMPRVESWGCQAVPENRAALEKDVERLSAENADLKSRLNELEAKLKGLDDVPRPPKPVPPESKPEEPNPISGTGQQTFSVPGREHIARAASAVQDAWQHFVEMVTTLKNDVMRKTGA